MLKNLELRWLKPDKGMPLPEIVVIPKNDYYCGMYIPAQKGERLINSKYYNMKNGILMIGEGVYEQPYESILAHEFRHHWQYMNGWKFYYRIGLEDVNLLDHTAYKNYVIKYYTLHRHEADALKFECTFSPSIGSLQCHELVTKYKEALLLKNN